MMIVQIEPWNHPQALPGVVRIAYRSEADGAEDWALAQAARQGTTWVVSLHGHGSAGDQIYTRRDLREQWLAHYLRLGLGIVSPNLRGNAWMCPEATADLRRLLNVVRRDFGAESFCFLSGSMGGTGNLIYAALHPEDVHLLAAMCPATDIVAYHGWLCSHPGRVRDEIRRAIEQAYGGPPDETPQRYDGHVATRRADRLTMPLLLAHATSDEVIPVEQSRRLAQLMSHLPNMTYVEIPGGNHDSPLHGAGMLEWLDEQLADATRPNAV